MSQLTHRYGEGQSLSLSLSLSRGYRKSTVAGRRARAGIYTRAPRGRPTPPAARVREQRERE